MEIIDPIDVQFDSAAVAAALHLRGPSGLERAEILLETTRPLIHARAVYKAAYIDAKSDRTVVIDGISFASQVLRKNLDPVERVFVYVLTIGHALEERASQTDALEQYYLDTLGTLAVGVARRRFETHLQERFRVGTLSRMNPGSLPDWGLAEQRPLFALLGDVESAIQVRLNESCLMAPKKSVSGIYFPTEVTFYSCQLCPRATCPSRQAPYDELLARQYGVVSTAI